ncbi:MAG TPA: hypothetical protein VE133_15745, partial [Candidatus Sulfotelmatobacter sp.]|nr:hypothetical protein [Candidatus Sulfotelmatobacter sp.]
MQIKRGQLKPAFGTARTQRFPAALAPEYAPIDERTCADQMSFALDFARLLSYYDDSNRLAGDWSGFFERDLAFLLARIVTTDFQREHFQAVAMQSAVRDGREGTKEILKSIYKAISRIDDWYRWAKEIADKELADNPVRMTLESIIQSDLSQYLGESMASILQRLPQTPGIESWPDYWNRWESRLHAVWRDLPPGAPSFTPALHPNPMDSLVAILQGVHHANHKLQQLARQYLEEMLSKRSDHPPHAALYIAFAKLLELLRGKINGTAGRHLDFYYRDVLGLTERDSSPDVAHLSFELAPQLREFILPAGTRLAAGKEPNGALREYATDSDLFINRARVGSLKALYLARDRYATSRNAPDRVINILALPKCDSEDGLGEPLRDAAAGWPTFGVNETSGRCVLEAQLNADLGFILSSSTLLLQEGERNITISIAFHEGNSLESALQAYQDVAADILDQPPAVELLLEDAFHLWLSTEKGWMLVSHPSFRRHPVVGTSMEIEFTLQPTDPPIVANSELAPEPQQSHWPMLKLALNPFARIFAYSFFKDLTIETIDIRVSVRGLKKMQLRNDIGLLSAAQPFPAFGPAPVQGSYLLLTHPELQVKRVDHAALTMTWFNLPKPPASLTSLYDAYNLGITDDSFKVRLSVFSSGTWIPPAINGLLPLFTRDFDRSGVLPATVVAFEVPELASPPGEPLLEPVPEEFTESQSPRGTIRLELAEPEFAFGHSIFPRLMADAAIANARAGKNGQHTPLPNPPLTPVLKSLVLDYDAAERLDLSRPLPKGHSSRFYHLSPFGYAEHQGRAIRMFTEFSEQGHLYLGMAEIGPQQSLTLLFHIRDAGFSPVPALHEHKDAPAPRLHWRYLTRNEWKDFPAEHVISDSTMGLTRSGIVKFLLPEDITVENTVMPPGICWIEAASEQVEGIYWCHVVSLATQAVTATRICDPHMELLPPVLPAGSITQFVEKKPQIKAISQPFDSRLGRTKEDAAAFRMRV